MTAEATTLPTPLALPSSRLGASPSRDGGTITVSTFGASLALPELVANAGEDAARASLEFFTARIPNEHTRGAYLRAVVRFCSWCANGGVTLEGLNSVNVASYLQALEKDGLKVASVKQHFAGIRHWLDWLTQKGVIPFNPASAVRGPRLVVREGKTPVLERAEAARLLASLDAEIAAAREAARKEGGEAASARAGVVALRDRALISVMLFNVPRVSAVCGMNVCDFDDTGDGWLVIHEKRGKERRIPAHHQVREALRAYMNAAGFEKGSKQPMFPTAPARTGRLSSVAMSRTDSWAMVKRRCKAAGLSPTICNHSFRATGLTIHHENGGSLQAAAELAGHESTRTTQRYIHSTNKAARAEVERVQL